MELDKHRKAINEIDKEIIELINKRSEHVIEIGEIKRKKNQDVYNPQREKEIFEKVEALSKGKPFPVSVMRMIFREIISASRVMEAPLQVAFFGPEASFTHSAAIAQFGSSTEFIPMKTIADVFKEVEVGKYKYGVVPIENSNEGAVNYTLDMFISSPLKIYAENYLTIHHNLLSHNDDINAVKKIYSHPQALAQCRLWLMNNLPNAELIETTSTAEASKVIGWDKFSAAIASNVAAEIYNLNVLAANIEDNPENYTRFLVIAKEDCSASSDDKTSLIVAVKDEAGSLQRILSTISGREINMNKIESRPTKRKAWEYLFYIDIDGHRSDDNIAHALKELEKNSTFLKVLGSYPKMKVFADS